jgi:hypothetical protein
MASPVASGAVLTCSFGIAPGTLNVIPDKRVMFENKPVATIMDNKPFVNIAPFGLCNSIMNPITAGQTAAALGVLTPGTCTPVTTAPWVPGSPTMLVSNQPILTQSSQCICAYGGVITIGFAGTTTEQVP